MKNGTEMIICLEISKQLVKHIKAQRFLAGDFYGYSKHPKSYNLQIQP